MNKKIKSVDKTIKKINTNKNKSPSLRKTNEKQMNYF